MHQPTAFDSINFFYLWCCCCRRIDDRRQLENGLECDQENQNRLGGVVPHSLFSFGHCYRIWNSDKAKQKKNTNSTIITLFPNCIEKGAWWYWVDWLHGNQHHHNESTNLIKTVCLFCSGFLVHCWINRREIDVFFFFSKCNGQKKNFVCGINAPILWIRFYRWIMIVCNKFTIFW